MSITAKRKLQVLQNSALRAVSMVNKQYSATVVYDDLKDEWLDVQNIKSTCNEVYKYTNGIGPTALTDIFKPVTQRRNLRSSSKITHHRLRTRTKFAKNDFVYRGKKYWDQLQASIQT